MRTGSLLGLFVLALGMPLASGGAEQPALQSGDVVVQTSRSTQSAFIQRATESPYSHVGLVEVIGGEAFVIEAVGPVKRTPWGKWRARGEGGRVRILRARGLEPAAIARVLSEAVKQLGKPYDPRFEWGDGALYCSELVYKAFERGAGLELGQKERLGDLKIAGMEKALAQRYGREVPLDLLLVTPASMASDPDLEVVYSTY